MNTMRRFKPTSKARESHTKLDDQQILLGGKDGYVYIMINFEVSIKKYKQSIMSDSH